MKIKISLKSENSLKINVISILLIIIFIFNVCWLKNNYYYDSYTVWNRLYRCFEIILFLYLVLLLLISIFRMRKVYIKNIFVLVIFLLVYELLIWFYCNSFTLGNIMGISIWPLCFLVGLIYCDKSILSNGNKLIIYCTIIMYGILSIPSIISHLNGRGNIGGVIFPVYILLAMGCFLLIQKDSIMKTILIIFIGIIILSTTKRTGLLCFIGGIIAYYFIDIYLKKKSIKIYFKAIIGNLLLFNIGIWVINKFNLNIIERFMSLESDGGSGRNEIWSQIYEAFINSNILSKVFGHGFHAISFDLNIQGRGILAHNDYIEYLYDFGLIGIALIISLLIFIFVCLILHIKNRSNLAPAFAYVFTCFILLSMFSYLMSESKLINLFALFLGMTFNNSWKK